MTPEIHAMGTRIRIGLIALLCLAGPGGLRSEGARTSENHAGLRKLLERRPGLDRNRDGMLTENEVRASRRERGRKKRPYRVPPTHRDVCYGEHESMVLDFWEAASDRPAPLFVWFHGGGFRGGDKSGIPRELMERLLESGVSVASVNYRLTHLGPYPQPMEDSARAIQFLRSRAEEWAIDPRRVAAGGGSAGSGIAQWLGFHDDLADPASSDPIERQSTRLSCVLAYNMQSTYDPRVIREIIPGMTGRHDALPAFYGLPENWSLDTARITPEQDALFKDASPVTHLDAGDPPVFSFHFEKQSVPGNIHHSNFGRYLEKKAEKVGVECVRRMDRDYKNHEAAFDAIAAFIKQHLDV
ncbi:alpha/beta hydrolase [Kiritimatiella glycovorans]|uniref:Carboxylesterase NlhH n=1 Tax=Kiritimatiella glycovorans TaxID=1307763 RepID=A0A0G3ECA7_9BACT|nr:alpha/beta hydrolase [Kiritimatiella glycovorans]AKJ63928.1 Carboxylesterase NlhH [Kiritimatiella glycovorans]